MESEIQSPFLPEVMPQQTQERYGSRVELPIADNIEPHDIRELASISQKGLDELIKPGGIRASSGLGPFSRIFGRDSFITINLLKKAQHYSTGHVDNSKLTNATLPLIESIAMEDNVELGIKRGQVPHEQGKLSEGFPQDWVKNVDTEGMGKNYDTADATGRGIITIKQELQGEISKEVREKLLTALSPMTEWAIDNIEEHNGLIGFTGAEYDETRIKSGAKGLRNHTWQDCAYSIVDDETGEIPKHPIKPIEEQALTWLALNEAADTLAKTDPQLSEKARSAAERLKATFNEKFVYTEDNGTYLARAIDGEGKQIKKVNIDVLIALGYTYGGKSILNEDTEQFAPQIIRRSMDELYSPVGGLRTQSSNGPVHKDNQYHGDTSYWPHANALAVDALNTQASFQKGTALESEYRYYATETAKATAGLLLHFGSPVELAIIPSDDNIDVYRETRPDGTVQESARTQAWTAAAGAYLEGFLKSQGQWKINAPRKNINQLAA